MLAGTQVCRSLKCLYFGVAKNAPQLTLYGFFVAARSYRVSPAFSFVSRYASLSAFRKHRHLKNSKLLHFSAFYFALSANNRNELYKYSVTVNIEILRLSKENIECFYWMLYWEILYVSIFWRKFVILFAHVVENVFDHEHRLYWTPLRTRS